MFGLTFEKMILIGVLAAFLIGPDKLPYYAERLGQFIRSARRYVDDTKARVKEEMGPEFDDVDWKKLDPRQYDPRRIIQQALFEDEEPNPQTTAATPAATVSPIRPVSKPLIEEHPEDEVQAHPVIKPASEAIAKSIEAETAFESETVDTGDNDKKK